MGVESSSPCYRFVYEVSWMNNDDDGHTHLMEMLRVVLGTGNKYTS